MPYIVTLLRGNLPPLTFAHTSPKAAQRRAYALIDLHGTDEYDDVGGSWTVDASTYYAGK